MVRICFFLKRRYGLLRSTGMSFTVMSQPGIAHACQMRLRTDGRTVNQIKSNQSTTRVSRDSAPFRDSSPRPQTSELSGWAVGVAATPIRRGHMSSIRSQTVQPPWLHRMSSRGWRLVGYDVVLHASEPLSLHKCTHARTMFLGGTPQITDLAYALHSCSPGSIWRKDADVGGEASGKVFG